METWFIRFLCQSILRTIFSKKINFCGLFSPALHLILSLILSLSLSLSLPLSFSLFKLGHVLVDTWNNIFAKSFYQLIIVQDLVLVK